MVWQIKTIIHSVNCFDVINLAHKELILTIWDYHRTVSTMGISRLLCCAVNRLRQDGVEISII